MFPESVRLVTSGPPLTPNEEACTARPADHARCGGAPGRCREGPAEGDSAGRLLHRGPGHFAPLGPRPVVHADAVAPEQMGQDEPRGAGAAADRAVGDQPVIAVEVDGGEAAAQVGGAPERPALVVEAVDGLVDRGRDVTG